MNSLISRIYKFLDTRLGTITLIFFVAALATTAYFILMLKLQPMEFSPVIIFGLVFGGIIVLILMVGSYTIWMKYILILMGKWHFISNFAKRTPSRNVVVTNLMIFFTSTVLTILLLLAFQWAIKLSAAFIILGFVWYFSASATIISFLFLLLLFILKVSLKGLASIGTWLIIFASVGSLVMAIGLIFVPSFPTRSYLTNEKLMDAAINIFGILAAGLVASVALLYITRQSQNYIWKRDQALKDVENIYTPLYQNLSKLKDCIQKFGLFDPTNVNEVWGKISGSPFGTKLSLTDEELFLSLKSFYGKTMEYFKKKADANCVMAEIAKTVTTKYFEAIAISIVTNEGKNEGELLDQLIDNLGLHGKIYEAFVSGQSFEDFCQYNFDTPLIIQVRTNNIAFSNDFKLDSAQITSILTKIFDTATKNQKIKEFRDWAITFGSEAEYLQKILESRILKPQLP